LKEVKKVQAQKKIANKLRLAVLYTKKESLYSSVGFSFGVEPLSNKIQEKSISD
jgi:hypothetical protein